MMGTLKAHLPWWAKLGAKLVLSRLPFAYGVWQRIGLFRHGYMDAAEYALGVFDSHLMRAGIGKDDVNNKTILEIGPGDSIATAIIAASYGAKAILVDTGQYASNDVRPYLELSRLLDDRGLTPIDISSAATLSDVLRLTGAQYLTNGLDSWRSIQADSVDLVFSQAVLEHVRKRDLLSTQTECLRVMKSTAVASHRVDLRDHLGGALNNLRFSDKIWESEFFAQSGFYTNRIRMSSMLEMFREVGFEVVPGEARRWDVLPMAREKLSKEFRAIPDQELCVSGFDVLLRK